MTVVVARQYPGRDVKVPAGVQLEPIKTVDKFFSLIDGDRELPARASRDIAAAAAKLLDSSWSGQVHVAVLGPEDLSFNDMARIMSDGNWLIFFSLPIAAALFATAATLAPAISDVARL